MNTRQRIILAVANGCNNIPAIASRLGVSRSTVYTHLLKAKGDGVVQWELGKARTLRLVNGVQVLRLQNAAGEVVGVYGIKHVYNEVEPR